MTSTITKLPSSELEVMQIIWELDPPVARADLETQMHEVHPIAQTTLLTLISRLVKKGFIKTEKNGRSSQYYPLITKEAYLASESRHFVDKMCGGSVSAFASAIIDSGLSSEDIAELRMLLEKGEL